MSEQNGLSDKWELTTLDKVVSPLRISVHPTDRPELPYIGMEHVEPETMRLVSTGSAEEMKSNARLFRPGDVLYGRLRPYLNKVYRQNFEGLCSAEFIVFPESPGVDNRYLQYFLNSWSFKRFASHLNTGDRPRVDWDQLKEYGFPLPPHSEQHRIVAAIEEQFSRLDAGVSALERVQTNLKRYRTSVLKAAVEGRLTAAWREEHPDVEPASELLERILKERRERWEKDRLAAFEKNGKRPPKNWRSKYKEPTGPNTEDLPDLPEGWTQATVAQVARSVKYGSSAKTSNDPSGVPVLRMRNIQNGTLDLENLKYLPTNHPEFPDLLLQDGDLLFNRTNSTELVGKSAVYRNNPSPCSYASYLIGARLIEGCVPEHVGYYLNSFHGRSWIASVVSQHVGQAKVNGTKLQALTFPLPPLFEQEAIVKEAKRRLSVLDEVEAEVEANLKRAARLRQAILKRAFEGKLVPQDPTDEPASELLARIRAEREQSAPAKRPEQGSTREPQPSLFPGTNT